RVPHYHSRGFDPAGVTHLSPFPGFRTVLPTGRDWSPDHGQRFVTSRNPAPERCRSGAVRSLPLAAVPAPRHRRAVVSTRKVPAGYPQLPPRACAVLSRVRHGRIRQHGPTYRPPVPHPADCMPSSRWPPVWTPTTVVAPLAAGRRR